MSNERAPRFSFRTGSKVAIVAIVLVSAAIAWTRVGMLDLPSPPSGVTLESSGLASLLQMAALDSYVRFDGAESRLASYGFDGRTLDAAKRVRAGIQMIGGGDEAGGLAAMSEGVRLDPANLVLLNAYRLAVFEMQRANLRESHKLGILAPAFPNRLRDQPMTIFESLLETTDAREIRLHLALAWVDKMLLFPALEIKAPSSVESVQILTGIINNDGDAYVPALFARGLNHLHRPARLVWPESDKTPLDAAARDIGMCVAIGRRLRVGSDRLQAHLAIALGDAYVKAGRLGVARSWWQIAQNLSHDQDLYEAVRERYGWDDHDILDRLELELDKARSALDRPMTDLALMWN